MQVKKYVASDIQEAIRKIKKDLGSNAVIISTRKVKQGGFAFGLFGKPMLEVSATKEKETVLAEQYNNFENNQSTQSVTSNLYENKKLIAPIQEEISELKDMMQAIQRGSRRDINDEATVSHMKYELNELKKMVDTLLSNTGSIQNQNIHKNLLAILQQLIFNGVEDKFARRLIEEVQKKVPPEEIENFSYVKLYIARMFMQVIKVNNTLTKGRISDTAKILVFIGPTGVGKTTSIAKMAANYKMSDPDLNVGLITIDTFRIAAVQQLQEYGRIIKIPTRVVSTNIQLDDCIREFQDKDLILIDTAGRSQRDEIQMTELRTFLDPREDIKKILVLSVTTKDEDLTEITKRFGSMNLDGIIFTKLDETTSYGCIFNHAIRFKIPLSYLSTGQNVPEDFELVSKERLIDLLLNISSEN